MSATLDTYEARGYITRNQHNAGKMFQGDWLAAVTDLRHRSMERKPKGDRPFDMGGVAAARCHKAQRALGELRYIVVHVCCLDKPAKTWAEDNQRKPDDAMGLLRFGLDVLHRFYAVN